MAQSKWDKLGIEAKLKDILGKVKYHKKHHFGRPYHTAYQLAIAFAERFGPEYKALGYPIGGVGIGQRNSLAQYLAGQLSRRIRKGIITRIEGAFVSKSDNMEIKFRTTRGRAIKSSLTNAYDLSMFRLKAGEPEKGS